MSWVVWHVKVDLPDVWSVGLVARVQTVIMILDNLLMLKIIICTTVHIFEKNIFILRLNYCFLTS